MIGRTLLAALVIAAFSLGGCATVPEPLHKVVSRNEGYEVREYDGYLVAETTVSGPWKDALNEGFRRLFSYISGNNEGSSKVAMTAPVLSGEPEKIAMTAPVLQEAGTGDMQVVSFIAPTVYTMETIPAPKDPRIRIRQVPPFTAAVLRYGGWTDPETVERKTEELRSLLARDGRTRSRPSFPPNTTRRGRSRRSGATRSSSRSVDARKAARGPLGPRQNGYPFFPCTPLRAEISPQWLKAWPITALLTTKPTDCVPIPTTERSMGRSSSVSGAFERYASVAA